MPSWRHLSLLPFCHVHKTALGEFSAARQTWAPTGISKHWHCKVFWDEHEFHTRGNKDVRISQQYVQRCSLHCVLQHKVAGDDFQRSRHNFRKEIQQYVSFSFLRNGITNLNFQCRTQHPQLQTWSKRTQMSAFLNVPNHIFLVFFFFLLKQPKLNNSQTDHSRISEIPGLWRMFISSCRL